MALFSCSSLTSSPRRLVASFLRLASVLAAASASTGPRGARATSPRRPVLSVGELGQARPHVSSFAVATRALDALDQPIDSAQIARSGLDADVGALGRPGEANRQ